MKFGFVCDWMVCRIGNAAEYDLSSSLGKAALALVVSTVGAVFVIYLFLAFVGIAWSPYTCLTDTAKGISGPSGHGFEISETSCSGVGKGPSEISVFVSRADPRKKALLFKYEAMHDGNPDALPIITTVDERTAKITVKHVASIICRTGKWQTLTIDYSIGRVVDAGEGAPNEC